MPRHGNRWKDLTGMRFGKLTATKDVGTDRHGHSIWLCHCDCGKDCETTSPQLLRGQKTNCGCDTKNKKDATRSAKMVGRRFGMLEILERAGSNKAGRALWLCRCECGNEIVMPTSTIKSKRHCGCQTKRLQSEASKNRLHARGIKTHGDSNSRLYRVFIGMIDRCEREGHKQYANYGGRGIKVCVEWRHDYSAFREWALANGYDEGAAHGDCTIDRIDPDGDYSPTNCRFIDMRTQQNNKRNNRLVTMDGKTQSVTQWCRELGLNSKTVNSRIHMGWKPVDALTKPIRHEFASKGKATA